MLVFVAWLNMAMAPCAMAFGGEHQCPHGGAATDTHAAHQHGQHDHHGAGNAADCGGAASECCDEQDVANDSRPSFEKQDFCGEFASIPVALEIPCEPASVSPLSTGPPGSGRFAAEPPVNLLNCVFLD